MVLQGFVPWGWVGEDHGKRVIESGYISIAQDGLGLLCYCRRGYIALRNCRYTRVYG